MTIAQADEPVRAILLALMITFVKEFSTLIIIAIDTSPNTQSNQLRPLGFDPWSSFVVVLCCLFLVSEFR